MAAYTASRAPAEQFYSAGQLDALRHRPSFEAPQLSAAFTEQPQRLSGSLGGGSFSEPAHLGGSFSEPQPQDGLAGSFTDPSHLGGSLSSGFDVPHLSAGFTDLPQRHGSSFEQPRASADMGYDLAPGSEIGYLGSPPRNGDLKRAVGSPAARSAVGSPVPGASRLRSPPREAQQGQPQQPAANGDAHHAGNGSGGNGALGPVEHCKLVILGLPWDTSEETLQVLTLLRADTTPSEESSTLNRKCLCHAASWSPVVIGVCFAQRQRW